MSELPIAEAARRIYRALEMSAGIMRDAKRTGGWEGAQRTADAFERQAIAAKALHARLAQPPATPTEMGERVARMLCEQHGGDADAIASDAHDMWEGALWTVFVGDARKIIAALSTPSDEVERLREAKAIWRCAIGDVTSALDILKNRWIESKRKAEREAGAALSNVLDLIWAARDPAAATYDEAAANGKVMVQRVRAALAAPSPIIAKDAS